MSELKCRDPYQGEDDEQDSGVALSNRVLICCIGASAVLDGVGVVLNGAEAVGRVASKVKRFIKKMLDGTNE